MKNITVSWRTTAGGILSGVGAVLMASGPEQPIVIAGIEFDWKLLGGIMVAIGTAIIGLLARDNGVSSEDAGAK